MNKSKIIILHDTFLYKGGGERLILMMGKILDSDIASGFFSQGSFDLKKEGFLGKIIPVSSEVFTRGLRHIKLKWSFLFHTKFLQEYDTVIFSGDCISAVRNCNKKSKKIYYCHTPPRYIYDLHDLYLKKVPIYLRPFFKIACKVFRYLYEKDLSRMDVIVTNSKNTQKRIEEFTQQKAKVLYPPVDIYRFTWKSKGNYFLSFARLADAKRVDRVVQAFRKLPHEEIIIIYGKNDPQKEKIFALAEGYPNIKLITLDNNDLLYDYIGNARATIYIPIDEDFGMSPIESMSAGKPVLGVNDGGLKETIIHKKTGYLIPPEANINDICMAIEYLSPETCFKMKKDCEVQASNFNLESFEKELRNIIT